MSFDIQKVENLYPEAGDLMIEPMLIWKLPAGKEDMLSEVCQSGDYFLEEKIDGALYQFVKTENYSYLFGRSKSVKTGLLTEKSSNVPHILEAFSDLPPRTILIGEIYVPGGTSKDVTSIMGCLPDKAIKRQEKSKINYYVHDIIMLNGESLIDTCAEARYNILYTLWNDRNYDRYDFLRLAIKVENNFEEEISRILNAGGEGVVLKKRDYKYVPGKRPAWSSIKVKQMDSTDLVCTGLCDATREYTGKELETWPYWEERLEATSENEFRWSKREELMYELHQNNPHIYVPVTKYYFFGWKTAIKIGAYNDEGNLVELGTVSSGLTDEIKEDMTENPNKYIGRVCSLDCMSIDKERKTLRHPAFKEWRDDKDSKDCLISEIFA